MSARFLRHPWAAGLLLGAALLQLPAAQAVNTPGTDSTAAIAAFVNLTPNASLSNTTYGYEFTTSKPIIVRSLGVFDTGLDGLGAAHDVGLWSVGNNTPLASVQVPSGSLAALVNGFRYQNLASTLALQAGTYRIGALYLGSTDSFVENVTGGGSATTGAGISLGNSFYSFIPSTSLSYPNFETSVKPGYIGPNFQYSEVPGPLPLLGAATAFGYSRRLRQRLRRRPSAD